MLRSPQHLVLQLSVAPTRRTLTTAAASYNSEKSPPPPPPPLPSSHASHASHTSSHSHTHTQSSHTTAASVNYPAAPVAAATVRVFRLTSEPNVAARNNRRGAMASQSQSQQRSRSEERPMSQTDADHADSVQQTRTPSRLNSYFPLGYRDAVHQWVSCLALSLLVSPPISPSANKNSGAVSRHRPPNAACWPTSPSSARPRPARNQISA